MISYASPQRAFADALHARLAADGACAPKLDHLDIPAGARWRQTLAWWLSACHTAVLLLSHDALRSPYVGYEVSVLHHRCLSRADVRLVLVYLGIGRDAVSGDARFAPFELGELQGAHELPDPGPDANANANAIERIAEEVGRGAAGPTPVDHLAELVSGVLDGVAREFLTRAFEHLGAASAPVATDPWLTATDLVDRKTLRRDFAMAFCSAPVTDLYDALESLVDDVPLGDDDVTRLLDLNVMTLFDMRLITRLRAAAERSTGRSLVAGITRQVPAVLATEAVRDLAGSRGVYHLVVNGPPTGRTASEMADSLSTELLGAISQREDPGGFLARVQQRGNPAYVLLHRSAGITAAVLDELERRYPQLVFVVLASAAATVPTLARRLGREGVGADFDDPQTWRRYLDHELVVEDARDRHRADLRARRRWR